MADIKFSDEPLLSAATDTLHIPVVEGTTEGAVTIPQIKAQILSAGLTLTSGQIAFPAVQVPSSNANTLDDYEEGTWTPSLGGNTTYAIQSGAYTKIGRAIILIGTLSITTLGTGSPNTISGIPAGITPTVVSQGSVVWNTTAASYTTLVAQVTNGDTTVLFYGATAAAATATFQSPFQNGTIIRFTVMYYV